MTVDLFCIAGIDPGVHGAISFFFAEAPDRVAAHDLPVAGGEIDAAALKRLLHLYSPNVAVIERVASRPGQGVASTFKFGAAYGAVRGVVAALDIPTVLVPPARWKKHWRLGSDKEAGRALAIRLWPASDAFERKSDHNRAEAALIARWYAETTGGAHGTP